MSDSDSDPVLPYDLDTIALITGINPVHLERMYRGDMIPNQAHKDQLVHFLGERVADLFLNHSSEALEYVESRYGRPPVGYQLLRYTPAANIQPGDLIAYRPPHRITTSAWIEVIEVEIDDTLISVTTSETAFRLNTTVPVRLARLSPGE